MGWCYTFGIRCGADCNHPMLVREGTRSCACRACGATCTGKFSNCHEIIFRPGGLEFQIRCLPDEAFAELGAAYRRGNGNAGSIENHERAAASTVGHSLDTTTAGRSLTDGRNEVATVAPIAPPPHRRSPTTELQIAELRTLFTKLVESTAAVNLSVARLESEVASLRRDLTALAARVSNIPGTASITD
jgi:hypothetical protein